MQTKFSRRSKRGFTLQEMLLVILLFIILAGLAIPGVIALQRSLHMKKLDEYARQIYVAAQNEMTELKASGRLELLAKQLEVDNRRLTEKPQDYPYDTGDDKESWKDLFWISSADATCANYLPTTIDSLTNATEKGGQFILEVNPLSGDVYSAFYAESGFTYDGNVLTLENRQKSTRQKADPQLGYYGGDTNEFGTVGMPSSFDPKIDVINGEELGIKVSCSNLMALRRTQRFLTLTLTVQDESSGTKTYTYHGGTDFFVNGDSITVTEILDSIAKDKNGNVQNFATLTGLHPGDNLTITAKLEYNDVNNNIAIVGDATRDQVSSLFESKQQTADGKTVISVNHVRHLNNLRASIYADATVASVVQSSKISFLFSDWQEGTDYISNWDKNPMDSFPAVTNDVLFTNGSYDGQGNALNGFVFTTEEGSSEAALFGTLKNTTLSRIRLTDCASNGTNAATLAGTINNCNVTDCGAYLNTKTAQDYPYNNMDERRGTYRVNGTDTGAAGGLIAVANGGTITSSFGAVDVNGTGNVGGLVGQMTGTTVSQSYGSGNITSKGGNNGGLIGQMSGGSVSDCYASGNVTAAGIGSGGLIGTVSNATVSDNRSYGKVTDSDGNEPANGFGGFVGSYSGSQFSNCAYLLQASYNFSYGVPNRNNVTGQPYTALRDAEIDDLGHIENSTPYLDGLREQGFPFPLCKNGETDMMHYGDWPQPYQLQTSLVYYERYEQPDAAGNYYGYYARTSLSGGDGSNSSWIVDSLRDEVCVEDGYALMTVYKLKSFTYTLDTGTGTTSQRKTVTINDSENALETAKSTESALMLSNASLVFENENSQSHQETTITGAWVYRLPFDLQVNERLMAKTFWETLTVTGTSVLNDTTVFENQVFYYCPDFAKNAVNPVAGSTTMPREPGGADNPVYVRSARQLNALSRSIYYWNTTTASDGNGQRIEFVQETDIDFGKYIPTNTQGKKMYCGVEFNLMETDTTKNKYANKPIGYSNEVDISVGNKKLESNFQNTYDGRSHKIIDYCQDDPKYRFSGLFGEVSQCIIKNVVMVASDPEHESAYVKGGFHSSQDQPGSVAALVGLVYMEKNTGNENGIGKPKAVIENCSATGYVVEYYKVNNYNYNYALGGLIGFNFGVVRNCSAVCTVRANSAGSSTTGYIGGLVGSLNGVGTIENSYSGSTFTGTSAWMSIGGICGGFCDIYGHGQGNASLRNMIIANCYSYCTIDKANLTAGGYGHIFGTVVTLTADGNSVNGIKVSNCYYLTDTISDITLNATEDTTQSKPCSRAELRALTFAQSTIRTDGANHGIYDGDAFESGTVPDADHSFHYATALNGKTYPFPGLVRKVNADGSYEGYVHYGDWPDGDDTPSDSDELKLTQPTYLVYYEEYTDSSYGVYSLGADNGELNNLSDDKPIAAAGYGFLTNTTEFAFYPTSWTPCSGAQACGQPLVPNYQGSYALYTMSDTCKDAFNSNMYGIPREMSLSVNQQTQTLYVNSLYAKGIFPSTTQSTYAIRTAQQLQNSNTQSSGTLTFVIERDIAADSSIGMIYNHQSTTYQGNDHAITGLTKPLFDTNNGTVNNLRLVDVNINTSGNTAAMAVTNQGTISGCLVSGDVTSDGNAAGLAYTNSGTSLIDRCAVQVNVSGVSAAGVVYEHTAGTISNSYYNGTLTASVSAAGCYLTGWASARNCYTTATFDTASTCDDYGFAPEYRTVSGCYYTYDHDWFRGSGIHCDSIDWTLDVDTNGIPKTDWPYDIVISNPSPYSNTYDAPEDGDSTSPAA